jgi:ABC-type dipeptide/oligopeptide/nickel transport system permease subunit
MRYGRYLKYFFSRGVSVVGLVILLVVIILTLLADVLPLSPPNRIDLDNALRAPSVENPLGTDAFGRDVLSRVLHGARLSLGVGFLARTISLLLGLFMGMVAGYFGGKMDSVIMRLADITFAFPALLLLIAVMAVVTPGFTSLFVTLGVVGWAAMARLIRSQVLSVKERAYVQAAISGGASHFTVLVKHILPQCISPVIVVYTLGLGMTIMAESSLSFLGLGVQPPSPSWGKMISSGIAFMRTAPWLTLFPGLILTLTVCSFNLVGDGLRDAIDPRMKVGRGRTEV